MGARAIARYIEVTPSIPNAPPSTPNSSTRPSKWPGKNGSRAAMSSAPTG